MWLGRFQLVPFQLFGTKPAYPGPFPERSAGAGQPQPFMLWKIEV